MENIKLSESVQNYLKVIYKLETEKGEATTSDIAYELNISSASVTGMLKRLASMQLVNYSSYKGVSLTDDGLKIALEVLRHHRLLEAYLRGSMGYKLARLHDEACKLEHYVSDEFIEKVTNMLGDPDFSPLGHPIPRKDGEIPLQDNISLIDLKPVVSGVISSIDTRNNELINYLDQIGLIPGKKITLHEIAPFYGPIVINLEGKNISIGYEVAKILKIDKSTIEYS